IVTSPASSSSAMNGVVFHTSAAMITANELKRPPNQLNSSETKGRWSTKPDSEAKANCQAKAATTVMIPYGISTEVRTTPRPKIARFITSAIAIPSTSSIATETMTMNTVLKTSVHHSSELSTVP